MDLIYYGNQQKLEYDFVVQPGANLNRILLEFSGADKITLDDNGDLLLQLAGDSIRQHKPIVYQEIGGVRQMLSGNYVLHSGIQVGFEIADYDKSKPLIIDPVLAFSTTFGGNNLSRALGIALDAQDNVYVTGDTAASDFPTVSAFQTNLPGARATFVTKFNTNGAVVYSTYLGGSATDAGQGIAVDGNGDVFVTGYTSSTNFPTKNSLQSQNTSSASAAYDAFVTEINSNGNSLVYSTYLGGTAFDAAKAIALDTNGDAIITGYTLSTNFPTANAAQPVYGGNGDAFVAKLTADGSALVYSTYLGGSNSEDNVAASSLSFLTSVSLAGNYGGAIAVDFDGNADVTGWTYSTNFPVLNAFQPTNATSIYGVYDAAFVTKFDPSGNLVYSTYFGGKNGDYGRAIGIDFNDNVYFAGNDSQGGLPTTNAFQPSFGGIDGTGSGDGFVAALDSTGTNLIYSTYLGGGGGDQVNGIAVRPEDGAVAVTGVTDSPNFPLLQAVQPAGFQGLFKSTDGANTWNSSNSGMTSGNIFSIQVDPSNPSVIYALVGVGSLAGVFKSTDGGADWTSASSGLESATFAPVSSHRNLLALDPQHSGTLYVGLAGTVFKTTNSAASWTSAATGLPTIQAVAVDPVTPTTLYLGTSSSGVYKSANGGNSWNAFNTGLTNLNVQALVVDPQNSSNVYAGALSSGANLSLFKSANGGTNWNVLGGGLASGSVPILAAWPAGSSIYAVVNFGGVATLDASTNGGVNWSPVAQDNLITALAVAPPSAPAMTIASSGNNDNVSWPASFGGYVLQSTPSLNPVNWKTVLLSPATNGGKLVVTVPMSGAQGFYRLLQTNSAAAAPPTIYLGTDLGVMKSTDGGIDWNVAGIVGNTINALAASPTNPASVYAGLAGGSDAFVSTLTSDGQLYFSTYLGGSGADQGNAIAIDFENAYVAGSTSSSDFPITASPFVAHQSKIKPDAGGGNENLIKDMLVLIGRVFDCPHDYATYPITVKVSDIKDGVNIGEYRTGGTYVVSGSTPANTSVLSLHGPPDDPYNYTLLKGNPTPGAYVFYITYTETDASGNKCSWTVTYSIYIISG